jgi:hypothetical protein
MTLEDSIYFSVHDSIYTIMPTENHKGYPSCLRVIILDRVFYPVISFSIRQVYAPLCDHVSNIIKSYDT